MTVRIFKHDRNELLKQGIEIISSTNDTKYHNRVVLVNLLLTGKISISLMSKASGLTTRTLSNWLSIVDNEGFEKLRAIKQSGRPDKLSDEQKAEIKKVLRESPDKHGYCVWDGISLSDYITSKYDIKYSIRQCQRLFHELGFSLQRAGTFPSLEEQNGSEREKKKKKQPKSGTFHGSDYSNKILGPCRFSSQDQVAARTGQNLVQWFCCSQNRSAFYG